MLQNITSQTDLSGCYFVYNGSVQNEIGTNIRGISHLCEHLIHNNNKHLYNKFSANGIDHNAFTSNKVGSSDTNNLGLNWFLNQKKRSDLADCLCMVMDAALK